jgi:hypothetical protein
VDKADFFGTSLSPETGGSDIKTVQRIAKNTIALSLMTVFRLVASVILNILVA